MNNSLSTTDKHGGSGGRRWKEEICTACLSFDKEIDYFLTTTQRTLPEYPIFSEYEYPWFLLRGNREPRD